MEFISKLFFICSGWTPLLKAIWARKEKLVDLLIQNGADVNHELRSGQRWSGNVKIADMVIKYERNI